MSRYDVKNRFSFGNAKIHFIFQLKAKIEEQKNIKVKSKSILFKIERLNKVLYV